MPYRPTERTEARRVATRERIVAAAHRLIARGGYRAASVAAVAAEAGAATGSVYRHFPSKAELFAEVFRRASQREVDAVSAAMGAPGGEPARGGADDAPGIGGGDEEAAARIAAGVEAFARRALRARRLAWALIAEPVDPAVEAERLTYRAAYRDAFAAVLRDGLAAGELPPQDPDLCAAALVGGLAEALVGPLAPTTSAGPADDDALVAGLVAFALRSATGRAPDPVPT